jgi:hypothetical protein
MALIALVLMGFVDACKVSQNTVSKDGFTNLFNGKDLDNWNLKIKKGDDEMPKKIFVPEKNMVHVFKNVSDSLGLNKGGNETHGMMYTKQKYSRYIFKFEYKWGKKIFNNFNQFQFDAGMYYHVIDDKIWPKGIEYQVRYDSFKNENHTGDFWAPPGTSFQWYSSDSSKTFMASYNGGVKVPIKLREHRALKTAKYNALNDKWNQCEIIVMGNKYTIHKLNGEIVNLATDLNLSEGIIGLQSETAEIFYRNIMIKEFKEDVPIQTFIPDWKN